MKQYQSADEAAQVELLKAQYTAAVRATQEPGFAKRSPSDRQEHKFFLERLQFRLKNLGLSKQEIANLGKQPEMAVKSVLAGPEAVLQYARTAILVIHGIGEQNPYETLDQFARNLTRYLRYEGGIDDLTLSAQKIDHNNSVEAMIRLETARHGRVTQEDPQKSYIDIYEYYWAPLTEDQISYKQTISWLIKTTLTPIRMLDQNIIAIQGEPDSEGLSRSAIFWREMRRIALLFVPVLALVILMGAWLPSATTNLVPALKQTAQEWSKNRPVVRGIMTVLFAISLVMYWVVVKQLAAKWLRWLRQQTTMMDSWVTFKTFVLASAIGLAGIGLGYLFKVDLPQYVKPVLNRHIGYAVLAAGAARVLQYFLATFVGDVAVYVNVDAKAKNFAVRRAILNGAATAITRILKDEVRAYDQVIVAGHSLGSVIAYDSLNELLNRCEGGAVNDGAIYATPDQIVGDQLQRATIHRGDLARIKGLVTFGSPLDKVRYFFRESTKENQSIRAQVLSFLGSFRTRPSGRDYSIYRLQPYRADQLGHVKWLNAWSKEDPVSGMLHFYAPLIRQEFDYLIPIYAHLSYWEDLRFYAFFAEPLLLGRAVTAPPKVKYAVA
jgi:hypothetical protein